jgi:Ca2+-binding RTX toxin-like protein
LVVTPAASATTVSIKVVPFEGPRVGCKYFSCADTLTAEIVAGAGERNVIEVDRVEGGVVVRDAGAPLTARSGCTAGGDGSVRCPPADLVLRSVEVTAGDGDGDDRVTGDGQFDGGAGDDTLTSHSAGTLFGGDGADVLNGSAAADRLTPGPGSDRVAGGPGEDLVVDEAVQPTADVLDGGPGFDSLQFTGRAADVDVDFGPAGQTAGSAGEGNTVTGFEIGGDGAGDDTVRLNLGRRLPRVVPRLELGAGNDRVVLVRPIPVAVIGGPGDDVFVGSPGKDIFTAGPGADRIDAGAGPDELGNGDDGQVDVFRGGPGNDSIDRTPLFGNQRSRVGDRLFGGAGNDIINGGAAADRIAGGAGADRLSGLKGNDRLDGGAGNDVLKDTAGRDTFRAGAGNERVTSRDRGADRVGCGRGRSDRLVADRRDRPTGCEQIRGRGR